MSEMARPGADIHLNDPSNTSQTAPLTVTDNNLDILTWRLEDWCDPGTGTCSEGEAAKFGIRIINYNTAQLYTVGTFDYETKAEYKFNVFANDGITDSAPLSVTASITDFNGEIPFPGTPAAPSVSSPSGTSLMASWVKPNIIGRADVTDYDVRYCMTDSDCDYKQTDETVAGYDWTHVGHSGPATSTTIRGLRGNTEYEVQVRAANADGNSAWSESGIWTTGLVIVPDPEPPATPAAPVVEGRPGTVGLFVTWTAPDDMRSPIKDYDVQIWEPGHECVDHDNDPQTDCQARLIWYEHDHVHDGPATSTTITAITRVNDDGTTSTYLLTDNIYGVRVQATNAVGSSEWSNATQGRQGSPVKSPAPEIPVAPTVLGISTSSLSVTWMAPAQGGSRIMDYDVQYRAAGDHECVDHDNDPQTDCEVRLIWSDRVHNGTATTTTITGLFADTNYYARVRATNANGSSDWSLAGYGRTLDDKVPATPNLPTPTGTATSTTTPGDSTGTPGDGTATPTPGDGTGTVTPVPTPEPASTGGRVLRIEPAIRSISLSPGDRVRLQVNVYGRQDILDNSLALEEDEDKRPIFYWSDDGAGGEFGEPETGSGMHINEILYVAPDQPGTIDISVNIPHDKGCVGVLAGEDAEDAMQRCSAEFEVIVRRPSSAPTVAAPPMNPSGEIPVLLTDESGVAYAVFTPVEGGRFDGEGFYVMAEAGAVPSGEFIGVVMRRGESSSNVGQAHHSYTLAGDIYHLDVVDSAGEAVDQYRLNRSIKVCIPLPGELRTSISDLALVASRADGLEIIGGRVAIKSDGDLQICGWTSLLPTEISAGKRGAPASMPPVPIPDDDIVAPDTGAQAPSMNALIILIVIGLISTATGIAVAKRGRRCLTSSA